MKKIKITILLFLVCISVYAQEETKTVEGFRQLDVFISGTVSYRVSSTDFRTVKNFSFEPRLGILFSDKIVVGPYLNYKIFSSSLENPNSFFSGNNIISHTEDFREIGIFGRYYFNPLGKFSTFSELLLSHSNGGEKRDYRGDFEGFHDKESLQLFLGFGLNYFLNQHFALQTSWGGISYRVTEIGSDKSVGDFSFGFSLEKIKLGLLYKF